MAAARRSHAAPSAQPRRRGLVEDRTLPDLDGLAVEAERAPQQRVGVFQPARQRIVGMKYGCGRRADPSEAGGRTSSVARMRAQRHRARASIARSNSGKKRSGGQRRAPRHGLAPQRGDVGGVLRGSALEHRRSRHENIGAGCDRLFRRLRRDAAVDFQRDRAAGSLRSAWPRPRSSSAGWR